MGISVDSLGAAMLRIRLTQAADSASSVVEDIVMNTNILVLN
jgi:hypothetical protein